MVQKDAGTLFRSTDTSCIGELRSIGTFFSLSYVPGSYSSHDVEEYHFIRAPCAAIKHVYEAYRNFMKSGIESVWAHNDENNKDAASRNLSISDSLNVYFVHQNMYIIITIFYDTFLTLNKNSGMNFWEILLRRNFRSCEWNEWGYNFLFLKKNIERIEVLTHVLHIFNIYE